MSDLARKFFVCGTINLDERRRGFASATVLGLLLVSGPAAGASSPTDDQLNAVQSRIGQLERRLDQLSREAESAERERLELDAQLELADARVRETELLLVQSSEEVDRLRQESADLANQLDERRQLLDRHLEIMALLGRPGPLQLFFDAYQGGDLEEAVGTVSVLAGGQMRLVEEYHDVSRQHSLRLAELSRTLAQAREESQQLEVRKIELEGFRDQVARRQASLESSRKTTGATLEDLRVREAALQRLGERVVVEGALHREGGHPRLSRGSAVAGGGRGGAGLRSAAACQVQHLHRVQRPPLRRARFVAGRRRFFPGVVAYARHFKGYGNMVVLDHGNNVYSLVAGLGTIHVRVDQRVTMGMRLGLASPPTEGGNVYLEFRVGEKPQDPRRWLQLKGESSSQ